MEVLGLDQLGRLGKTNLGYNDFPDIDLPDDYYDTIRKEDLYFPDGSLGDLQLGLDQTIIPDQGHLHLNQDHKPMIQGQGHGPIGDPRTSSTSPDDISDIQQQHQLLMQQQHRQQQQQYAAELQHTQPHQQQCALHNAHYEHPHHHVQQQQQQQQQQHHQQQQPGFCSISGQPHLPQEAFDPPALSLGSLPDSPPDSEPYSPDGGRNQHMADGSMSSLPQTMYMAQRHPRHMGHPGHHQMGHQVSKVPPPAYMGEHKLNHHQMAQQYGPQHISPQMANSLTLGQGHISPQGHPILPAHLGSMASLPATCKKRKYSDSPSVPPAMLHDPALQEMVNIKQEPPGVHNMSNYLNDCGGSDIYSPYDDGSGFMDGTYQVLKWKPFNQEKWATLTNADGVNLAIPQYKVDADKGFAFSTPDEAFVCQKKNHFQVTVNMALNGSDQWQYVRTPEGLHKIDGFYLHIYGVKMEAQTNQQIKVEQSQSDRSKKSFHPVQVDLETKPSKKTMGRLHFSETTSNNMRKKGKPNPDQRYFLLCVSLHAHSGDKDFMVVGSCSDRIIVRASNPGQFDSDVDIMWQKGQPQNSIFYQGRIGVNTDHPDEALTVHGNMKVTGKVTSPSDMRVKENINKIDNKSQLENLRKVQIYNYRFRDEYADKVGIPPESREATGVLAQELLEIIPSAVKATGDVILTDGTTIENLYVVDGNRVVMETVGAVQALDHKVDKQSRYFRYLEKKLPNNVSRMDSFRSNMSSLSNGSVSTLSTISVHSSVSQRLPNTASSCVDSSVAGVTCDTRASIVADSGVGVAPSSIRKEVRRTSNHSRSMQHNHKDPKKHCGNFFANRLAKAGLAILILCVITLVTLLAVMVTSQQDTPRKVVHTNSQPSTLALLNSTSITTTTASLLPSTIPRVVSTSTSPTTTSTIATKPPTTWALPPTDPPSGPIYQPVVPAFPSCSANYCESRCCPPPHEDMPVVIDWGDQGGEGPAYEPITQDPNETGDNYPQAPTSKRPSVVVNIPARGNGLYYPAFDINNGNSVKDINKVQKPTVFYNVINSVGDGNGYYRRKRGADDAPRPIISLTGHNYNYTLGDQFCREDGCHGQRHNYSYYIPLNPAFGYEPITVDISTPNVMSHMVLCGHTFMWNCPIDGGVSSTIDGELIQQTARAEWRLSISNHFRTILNFRVIHSLKGRPFRDACELSSDENYVVMNYTMQFQRTC